MAAGFGATENDPVAGDVKLSRYPAYCPVGWIMTPLSGEPFTTGLNETSRIAGDWSVREANSRYGDEYVNVCVGVCGFVCRVKPPLVPPNDNPPPVTSAVKIVLAAVGVPEPCE